jgi:putative transposase
MTIRPELIDELLKEYCKPEDLMGEGGIFNQLTKDLVERCLTAELDTHLEEDHAEPGEASPKNRRNGHSKKRLRGSLGRQRCVFRATAMEPLSLNLSRSERKSWV